MDKTEKAVLFEIHNMVSEIKTKQAVQAEKIDKIEKEALSVMSDVSKLKEFSAQTKIIGFIGISVFTAVLGVIIKLLIG